MEIEDLSKDILEENFVKGFRNIYRLQYIMGSSRSFIKNKFATPPTLLQKLYTIMFLIFTTGTTYLVSIHGIRDIEDESVKNISVSILVIIYFVSTCNIFHVRFLNGRRNADFNVRMQRLDRLMKLGDDKYVNGRMKKLNDYALIFISIACVSQQTRTFAFIGTSFCAFTIVLELLACSSVVVYFLFRLVHVNHRIQIFLKQEENVRLPRILDVRKRWINIPNHEDNEFPTCNVHICLREIFDLFYEFQELYRFQTISTPNIDNVLYLRTTVPTFCREFSQRNLGRLVEPNLLTKIQPYFLFTVKLVVLNLLTFELAFYAVKNSFQSLGLQIFILYALLDITIAGITAVRFGFFHAEVKETKRYCISVMSIYTDGPVREKARCMLRLIEESPPRFSVYNIWEVDARAFVTIFGLVTSLMVTLMQLTFQF